MESRLNLTFLERSVRLKKRISFFGIFHAGDELEIVQAQYDFLKEQFNKICEKLTMYENILVKISNNSKKRGEKLNEPFDLANYNVKKKNKVHEGMQIGLLESIESAKLKIMSE